MLILTVLFQYLVLVISAADAEAQSTGDSSGTIIGVSVGLTFAVVLLLGLLYWYLKIERNHDAWKDVLKEAELEADGSKYVILQVQPSASQNAPQQQQQQQQSVSPRESVNKNQQQLQKTVALFHSNPALDAGGDIGNLSTLINMNISPDSTSQSQNVNNNQGNGVIKSVKSTQMYLPNNSGQVLELKDGYGSIRRVQLARPQLVQTSVKIINPTVQSAAASPPKTSAMMQLSSPVNYAPNPVNDPQLQSRIQSQHRVIPQIGFNALPSSFQPQNQMMASSQPGQYSNVLIQGQGQSAGISMNSTLSGQTDNSQDINATMVVKDNGGLPLALPGYMLMLKKDVKLGKSIGKGGSATLYLATLAAEYKQKIPDKQVAVKVLKNVAKEKQDKQMGAFNQEVAIMAYFSKHSSFARLYGYIESPPSIVMKYYAYGALSSFIDKKKGLSFDNWFMHYAYHFACDILAGLQELHRVQIIHNDMKPQNVLVDKTEDRFVAVICDFSIANISGKGLLGVKEFKAAKVRGASLPYASPETIRKLYSEFIGQDVAALGKSTSQTYKLDIYSTSIMLFEVVSRSDAWNFYYDQAKLIKCILEGKRPQWPKDVLKCIDNSKMEGIQRTFQKVRSIIEDGWQEDFLARPSADQMLSRLQM
ncbi:hypothetical protein MP228_010396 [Amoeboaphelidium protococcarum]|nr:hypothetical protein MP228_010396 [Amoeboaphelidium protococcarum]